MTKTRKKSSRAHPREDACIAVSERVFNGLRQKAKRAGIPTAVLADRLLRKGLAEIRRRGFVSALDLAGDLVGRVEGPPDLSTNLKYMDGFGQ